MAFAGLALAGILLAGCTVTGDTITKTDKDPGVVKPVKVDPALAGYGLAIGDCFELTDDVDGVTEASCDTGDAEYEVFYVRALSAEDEEAITAGEVLEDVAAELLAAQERLNADPQEAGRGSSFALYEPTADGGVVQISAIGLK